MRERRWQQFDFLLLGCALALVVIGILSVHSATCGMECTSVFPLTPFAQRQALSAVAGLIGLVVLSLVDYRLLRAYAYHIYLVGLVLLGLVLVIGRAGLDQDYGALRWIPLGSFDLQSSEVAKLTVLIALARVLSEKPEGSLSLQRLLATLGLVALPVILVFVEPDLGTSLSYVTLWGVLVLFAGLRKRHALMLAGSGVLSLPLVWLVMKDYMRQRLMTYVTALVDPHNAPVDETYNIEQARISIGSGGMFGRGYLQGTQTQLDYLRIKQSDFIFSSFAEEMGFVGAMVLFGLFLLMILRMTRAADRAQDDFGRYLCFGVVALLIFQVGANLGANLTLLPVTGIPLPFISYGGSALLVNLMAVGLVESVLLYRLRYRY